MLVVLIYRFVVAAFCTGWMILLILHEKWFIWLSDWSFLLVTVYFICATIVTAIHYKRERRAAGKSASN